MHVGEPVILDDFQEKFFRDLFNEDKKIRTAIWSMAKKNAKTTTIACLALVFLVGPEALQNSQIVSGAMSREQAAHIFTACTKMIALEPRLQKIIKIIPSKKMLIGIPMNVTYSALSAESKTAHGGSPLVVIIDELGQVVGPRSEFFDALETSQGAHENPLMIIISTQAASDTDLLSVLIDDALTRKDDTVICHLYTAPPDCDIMDVKAWYAANPALGKFRSLEDVQAQAEKARRMPTKEASFRNFILNQRVQRNSPFIASAVWKECGGEVVPISECVDIYAGLDLSGRADLTALVLLGRHLETGTWNAYPYFWTPEKGLDERSKRDRAPYDIWVEEGLISACPGATIDYEFIATELAEITSGIQIEKIAYDRWRMDMLKKELEKIGMQLPLVEWGQGFKDMSPAIEALESKILNKTLRHGGNPVLTMCAANSVVITDPAKNRKLDKSKATGRIDGMVALAMAAGVQERETARGGIDDFISDPIILRN